MRYKNVTPSSTYNRKQYVFTLKFQLPLISLISGYVLSVANSSQGTKDLKMKRTLQKERRKLPATECKL